MNITFHVINECGNLEAKTTYNNNIKGKIVTKFVDVSDL